MDFETDDDVENSTTSSVILTSLQLYGSFFIVSLSTYAVVRPWFPLVYNFCNSVSEYNTKLARHHYGHIQWIYKNLQHSDEELFENCGLSALVMLRFLKIGFKLSLVGVFNSFYLIPVNLYGCDNDTDICNLVIDGLEKIAMGHVSQGSSSLVAATVAAYIMFGTTLWLIYKEFNWFTSTRHKFLSMPRPDNYSVYVAHIPEQYRGDEALCRYFKSIFEPTEVLEANVARDIFDLESKVAQREKLQQKLEHAINIKNVKGYEPTHLTPLGEKKQSIPVYEIELESMNSEISQIIDRIMNSKKEEKRRFMDENIEHDSGAFTSSILGNNDYAMPINDSPLLPENDSKNNDDESSSLVAGDIEQNASGNQMDSSKSLLTATTSHTRDKSYDSVQRLISKGLMSTLKKTTNTLHQGIKMSTDAVQKTGTGLKKLGDVSKELATNLVFGSDDGKVRDGGFVTFTSLTAKNQCVQMLHHGTPFTFQVIEAPLPKHVFWNNVGLTHVKQQLGYVAAQALTISLCLFWTIPIAAVTSFSQVESLKTIIPGLENAVETNPWIEPLLAQLGPMLIVVLKGLLPSILTKFCEREGHVSQTQLNASLFTKLSLFMIIQIFLVPALSGVLFQSLPLIIEQPTQILSLVAKNVPNQAKSFIQYIIITILVSSALELLRLIKIAKAYIRRFVGPNLTEEEKKMTFMGLEPLTEPDDMEFPMPFAEINLYMMILFVYSCISPIMSYVLLMAFGILILVYANQFIFIYNASSDEGGALWTKMVKMILMTVVFAELILIGILSINKSILSSTLMIPLLICTIFFILYLEQQHFKVIQYLPSTVCRIVDADNTEKLDLDFLREQYVQPALKASHDGNLSVVESEHLLEENESLYYGTPDSSAH